MHQENKDSSQHITWKINKKEALILGAIFLVLLGLIFWYYFLRPTTSHYKTADIYYENELIESVVLDGKEKTWTLELPENTHQTVDIEVHIRADRKIEVLSSNCPDKICVHTPAISEPGQSIACLPNHVIIKIEE